ncbi:hypothetical protein BGZ47_002001 [Haplosporangium gracile]|nr:hypothetical protein BGZ47_002001 [Haplosporangium gracile]
MGFMIDITSINFRSREPEVASRISIDPLTMFYQQERAKRLYSSSESGTLGGGAGDGSSEVTLGIEISRRVEFISTTSILTRRMFKSAIRQRGAYLNRIMEPFFIIFVVILFYWGLEDTSDGLLNRLGLFHQLMGGALSGLIIHLEVFPKELTPNNNSKLEFGNAMDHGRHKAQDSRDKRSGHDGLANISGWILNR